MSFTEAARKIAETEADTRVTTAQSRNEANRLAAEADQTGDTIYAAAIRRAIAARWPLRKAIDYTPKLEAANKTIFGTLLAAWGDRTLRELHAYVTQGKIVPELFQDKYAAATTRYAANLEDVLTEATEHLNRASTALAKRVRELTAAPSGSVEEQLLTETRAQREWARLRPQLDAIEDLGLIGHIAQLVPTATTPASRNVYVEELPAYLKGRGITRLPEHFISDLLVESDQIALEADRDESRAAEYVSVVRHNVTHALQLISPDGAGEFLRYDTTEIDRLEHGYNPRHISVDKANLAPIPEAQRGLNSVLGVIVGDDRNAPIPAKRLEHHITPTIEPRPSRPAPTTTVDPLSNITHPA